VPSVSLAVVLVVGLAAVIWLGVYPAPLLEAVEAASRAILPAG
jgi:NADH:ubiquinone oxidoreductase subunit 4 (subunit M)